MTDIVRIIFEGLVSIGLIYVIGYTFVTRRDATRIREELDKELDKNTERDRLLGETQGRVNVQQKSIDKIDVLSEGRIKQDARLDNLENQLFLKLEHIQQLIESHQNQSTNSHKELGQRIEKLENKKDAA